MYVTNGQPADSFFFGVVYFVKLPHSSGCVILMKTNCTSDIEIAKGSTSQLK